MDWTQKGVAKRLGVSRAIYNYWENGNGVPSRDDRKNIVSDFGLDEEEETALYKLATEVPPAIRYLPPHNPLFTGREAYLALLHQLLQESGSVALTQPVSLSGLGGIGKTQLALAYAYDAHPKTYRAVFWVNAADVATLQGSYEALARWLGLVARDERDTARCVQAVQNWLADHTNWLLVMDNADDLGLARSFFPPTTSGHILLTTRSQFAGDIGARQLEVDKMTQADALLFLLRRAHPEKLDITPDTSAPEVKQAASGLVALLDGHPLALDQAGAYVAATGVSIATYIELYTNNRRDLLERRRAVKSEHGDHPDSVVVTFKLSFEKAAEQHPLATDILRFCAFLQPDAILEELLQYANAFSTTPPAFYDGNHPQFPYKVAQEFITTSVAERGTRFHEGVAALRRYSLLKSSTDDRTFSMHRLVQAVLVDDMGPNLQKQWRQYILRALDVALRKIILGDVVKRWPRFDLLLPHIFACASWPEIDIDSNTITFFQEAAMLSSGRLFDNEPAEAVFWRMTVLHGRLAATENFSAGEALFHKSAFFLWWRLNDGQKAECLKKTIMTLSSCSETDLSHTARRLQYVAAICIIEGKYRLAEILYESAVFTFESLLGANHPETLIAVDIWAAFCREVGKYGRAERLRRQVRAMHEQIWRPDLSDQDNDTDYLSNPLKQTGSSFCVLAQVCQKDGLAFYLPQAATFYRMALYIMKQQLGAEHHSIETTRMLYEDVLKRIDFFRTQPATAPPWWRMASRQYNA